MKVKDKLNRGNWYKGGWGTNANGERIAPGDGTFCKMCLKTAAFLCNGSPDGLYADRASKLEAAINELYPKRGIDGVGRCSIAAFNDHPDTTWEDVEKVLERADV